MMPIELVTGDDGAAKSVDPVAENIAALKALFPQAYGEGKIDFDTLRQLLGDAVDDGDERYGLNWSGKRAARRLALTPSTATLRPVKEDSVDWATTQNLMIEGDNLEVLKLLQKSYAGKVKLIYIDPPYNTGSDFVYPDDYKDSIGNYLRRTGQMDENGVKNSSNAESSGRFHTDWLNMMWGRISLAHKMLKSDGLCYISIGKRELHNVLNIAGSIFGDDNLLGIISWKARVKPVNIGDAKYRLQNENEFVAVYQRSYIEGKFQPLMSGGLRSYPHMINDRPYRLQTILKSNRGTNFRNTMSFELDGYSPPQGQRWQAGFDEISRLSIEGYLEFRDGTPFRRYFEDEEGAEHDPFYCFMENEWSGTSEGGKGELNALLGDGHGFDTVKPTQLIKTLIQASTAVNNCDIILDFFAGSGTTGHAVLAQNAVDGGNRRYILVQLPEPLSPENKDQKTAADFCDQLGKPRTIAELTKERLRRAGAKIRDENPLFSGDTGFRTYKLSSSNIRAWNPGDDLAGDIEAHISNLLPDRSEDDLLTELLLKTGLDLTTPMQTRVLGNKSAQCFGGGALITCFADISEAEGENLADGLANWHAELAPETMTTMFFRDTGFTSNQAKLNLSAILEQRIGDKRLRLRSL